MKIYLTRLVLLILSFSSMKAGEASEASEVSEVSEVSVAGYMDQSISVETSGTSIIKAVHDIVSKMGAEDPDSLKIKFEFINSSKFSNRNVIEFDFKDEKFSNILDKIGMAYKHDVNYDFKRNVIVFTAAASGSDYQKFFRISEYASNKLGLNWSSKEELIKSLQKYDVNANIEDIDLLKRSFVASGRNVYVDHIDMLIYVISKIPK